MVIRSFLGRPSGFPVLPGILTLPFRGLIVISGADRRELFSRHAASDQPGDCQDRLIQPPPRLVILPISVFIVIRHYDAIRLGSHVIRHAVSRFLCEVKRT
jgi:hypothetical protein